MIGLSVSQSHIALWVFVASLVATIAVVVGWAIHRGPRPPRVLVGAGVGGLALAGLYVVIAAMLAPADYVGLWSPDLVQAVPTVLAGFGATAVSVWVAIWTADRARISSFVASEAALMHELRGVLLVLQRQMSSSREIWLGPRATAVACGKEIMEGFFLLEPNPETGSTLLFGDGGIAEYYVERDLRAVLQRAADDLQVALETARLVRTLEIRTGLPMDKVLSDVAFASLVTGATEGEIQTAGKPKVDLQVLAVAAACIDVPSGTGDTALPDSGSSADEADATDGLGWVATFRARTRRPERLQRELRSTLGSAPPTAFEALSSFPPAYLGWIARRWLGFALAHDARSRLIEALTGSDPETSSPLPFSTLSHSTLWQSVAAKARLVTHV